MGTLTFTYKGKKYVSKPFDMKAMCLVNEGHNDEDRKGPLMMCIDAVNYMFEDTDGAAVMSDIRPGIYAKLCTDCWQLYVAELNAKNE